MNRHLDTDGNWVTEMPAEPRFTTMQAMAAGRPRFYTVNRDRHRLWALWEHYDTGRYCITVLHRKVNILRRARLCACSKVYATFGHRCDLPIGHRGACGGSLLRDPETLDTLQGGI